MLVSIKVPIPSTIDANIGIYLRHVSITIGVTYESIVDESILASIHVANPWRGYFHR